MEVEAGPEESGPHPVIFDLSPEAPKAAPALLPTSSADTGASDSAEVSSKIASKTVDARTAVVVGAGVGALCVFALYMTMHSAGAKTPPPVAQSNAAPPPALLPQTAPAPAPNAVPPPSSVPPPAPVPKKRWIFTGVIYDLLTTRGVFGAGLIFVDSAGQEVGAAESDEEGRYRVTLPEGDSDGYSIRIMHEDYSDKHIVEEDAESTLRKSNLAQRQLLMRSRVRAAPWVGVAGERMRRDVGLTPLLVEKP